MSKSEGICYILYMAAWCFRLNLLWRALHSGIPQDKFAAGTEWLFDLKNSWSSRQWWRQYSLHFKHQPMIAQSTNKTRSIRTTPTSPLWLCMKTNQPTPLPIPRLGAALASKMSVKQNRKIILNLAVMCLVQEIWRHICYLKIIWTFLCAKIGLRHFFTIFKRCESVKTTSRKRKGSKKWWCSLSEFG